jgi:hypothetical protein
MRAVRSDAGMWQKGDEVGCGFTTLMLVVFSGKCEGGRSVRGRSFRCERHTSVP